MSGGTGALVGSPIDPGSVVELQASAARPPADSPPGRSRPRWSTDVDLVLTATRAHRGEVVRLSPRAMAYCFTLGDFADLVAAATLPTLGDVDPGASWVSQVAGFAASRRGMIPPRPMTESDIPDPYRQGPDAFAHMAREVEQVLPAVARVLTPPSEWAGEPPPVDGRPGRLPRRRRRFGRPRAAPSRTCLRRAGRCRKHRDSRPRPRRAGPPRSTAATTTASTPSSRSYSPAPLTRMIVAVDGQRAWRAVSGTCSGGGALLQTTTNAGRTWNAVSAPARAVARIQPLGGGRGFVYAAGSDCRLGELTTTDAARSWSGPGPVTGGWARQLSDPRAVVTPRADTARPCGDRDVIRPVPLVRDSARWFCASTAPSGVLMTAAPPGPMTQQSREPWLWPPATKAVRR